MIGSPQDYQKNKEKNNFPSNYELAIPVGETNQRKARADPADESDEIDYEGALEGMDNVEIKSNNLQQRRVEAPKVSDHF